MATAKLPVKTMVGAVIVATTIVITMAIQLLLWQSLKPLLWLLLCVATAIAMAVAVPSPARIWIWICQDLFKVSI